LKHFFLPARNDWHYSGPEDVAGGPLSGWDYNGSYLADEL
jgi:hypothetical protein